MSERVNKKYPSPLWGERVGVRGICWKNYKDTPLIQPFSPKGEKD